ncbi:MAG TPA: TetR/AcrR family transcriptional regulator [Marmoricola sp.]|nr:TetR/AcrR family transcriptional regulator [Marmoricola sp.]
MSPRSQAEKLRSSLPKGVSRRAQYSASTKRALVAEAETLFVAHGYAGTSLDNVVRQARVTKGALYHHFSGKQALFEAVFEKIEADASQRIRTAIKGSSDPWEKALIGLRAFLEVVQDPGYQRVVIQEGPAVLGYERFREQEERSSFGLVQELVRSILDVSTYELDDEMVATFSRIFFGAMSAAGESISKAEHPRVAVAQVETAIGFILSGLRSLADSGVHLPDPGHLLPEEEEG